MKVLLSTYSAETHSSYGKVTRELWTRLRTLNPDWEVVQHGWLHRSHESVPWLIEETRKVQTPQGPQLMPEDKYGQLSFESVVSRFKPDVVWTIADPFMCDYMGQYRPRYKFKLIKHIPIDGAPVPPQWGDALKDCDLLTPVTEFGSRALEPLVGYLPKHIYHGVDVNKYMPVAPSERNRESMGSMTEKTFVLGFVGHSQWRKQNWNMFAVTRYLRDGAWALCKSCDRVTLADYNDIHSTFGPVPSKCWHCNGDVEKPGPQDVALWYHTYDRANTDFQPSRLKLIWKLEGSVIFTSGMEAERGIPDHEMPYMFRMFDAYLSLSGGEGFCIPIIEAMASGVPVVYTDYSGQAEIGAYAGLPVRPAILQPNYTEPVNRGIADIAAAVRQIWRLMSEPTVRQMAIQKGLTASRDVFSWDVIANQWSKAISSGITVRRMKTIGVTL